MMIKIPPMKNFTYKEREKGDNNSFVMVPHFYNGFEKVTKRNKLIRNIMIIVSILTLVALTAVGIYFLVVLI